MRLRLRAHLYKVHVRVTPQNRRLRRLLSINTQQPFSFINCWQGQSTLLAMTEEEKEVNRYGD